MDPNWFYSTLSQSTAAIVGLIGGFLVQRVLVQRNEIGPARQLLRRRFTKVWHLIERTRGSTLTAKDTLADMSRRLEEAGGGEEVRASSVQILHADLNAPLSTLTSKNLHADASRREQFRVAAEASATLVSALPVTEAELAAWVRAGRPPRPEGEGWLSKPPWTDKAPSSNPGDSAWPQLNDQREIARWHWHYICEQVRDLSTEASGLRARLIPPSARYITATLAFLLVACVATPMGFLAAKAPEARTILLGFFTLGSLAVVGFLWTEVRRLGRAADNLHQDEY